MAGIHIKNFGGIVPKLSDRLLPDNLSTIARNTKLYSGELRPWRFPKTIVDLGGTAPISAYRLRYLDADVWMSWDADVDVVKAPLTNDAYDRYYWTGDSTPKINSAQRIANDDPEYKLGVPVPIDKPVVNAPQTGGDVESRVYAYTYVSAFGEEGPPIIGDLVSGPASYYTEEVAATINSISETDPTVIGITASVTYDDGDIVEITGSDSTPSIDGKWVVEKISGTQFKIPVAVTDQGTQIGSVTFQASRYEPWLITLPTSTIQDALDRNVTDINIYRTVSGYYSTDFFFVDQVAYPYVASPYEDSSKSSVVALSDTLGSLYYDPPPADLKGLIAHPNGFLVGFTGSDIYMSEPYRPHAYPPSNVQSVDYPIVGLGLIGNTVVIMTEVYTYAMSGIRPESMTLVQSNLSKPCVSKRSIVSFHDNVLYQSNDGIVMTNGSRIVHATLDLMTDTDWDELYGTKGPINASSHGNWYLAYCPCGSGFLLDFRNPNAGLIDLQSIEPVSGNYIDELSGDTYLIKDTKVYKFDPYDTPSTTYTWRSKEFELPEPLNFGVAQVKYKIPENLTGTDTELLNEIYALNTALLNSGALNTINQVVMNGTGPQHIYSNARTPINGSGIVSVELVQEVTPALTISLFARDTYYEKTLVFTTSITSQNVFRLPSGFKSDVWQVQLTGNVDVTSVSLATTGLELKVV